MGKGIKDALLDVLKTGGSNPDELIKDLENKGLYVTELWG